MATEGFICPSEFQPKTATWMSLCNNPLGPWFINLVWAAIGAIAGFLWHWLRNWRTQKDRLSADHRDYQARKDRLRNLQKSLDHEPGSTTSLQVAAVSGLIPEEHAKELKEMVVEKASKFMAEGNGDFNLLQGPKVVQWTVPLGDVADILDKLNDLAVTGTSVARSFNLQLDRLRLFHYTDEGVKILNLEDHAHQVPVILHASYAAGYLTIEGLHLSGAVITAATSSRSTALETKFMKGPSQMEIHRCFIQLPSRQVDEVFVYATKKIDLEGHRDVSVRSLAVPIQQDNLRAVLRVGLPSTMLVIYAVKQLWAKFGVQFVQKSDMNHALALFSPPVIVFLTQILPQSTEEKVKTWFKRGCLVVSTLRFATGSFLSKQDPCAQKLKLPRSIKRGENLGELKSDRITREKREDRIEPHVKELKKTRSLRAPDLPWHPVPVPVNRRFSRRDDDDYGDESETDSNETMPTLETMSTWEWPAYEEVYDQYGQVTLKKRSVSTPDLKDKDRAPFNVVYQHQKGIPWAEQVRVTIYSSLLTKVLAEFLPSELISVNTKKRTRIWVKDLFHIREALREKGREFAAGASHGDANVTELHLLLGVLLRFMDKEFEEKEETYSAMVKQHRASWDMLWALFPPGEKVVYQCAISDEEVCGSVTSTAYRVNQCKQWELVVTLTAWDYNGQTWRQHTTNRTITLYQGNRGFTELRAIRPLLYTKDPAGAEKAFLERGNKFCWLTMLAKERYMDYKGPIFVMKGRGPFRSLLKEKAHGRVMVDLGSFARMNPDYDMGSAMPPTDIFRDRKVESVDIVDTPERLYAPAIVYGFSFRLKKWGSFSIMGFEHITFNDEAFDALVMDPVRKDLLYRLVSEYIKDSRTNNCNDEHTSTGRVDPIANKGEGCISLCYGPPGTGKTLTAESIAEKLHCPLWSLSVSELGTDPEALESTLVKVLEIAASWGAVLLLDEADVYLERRNSSSLKRNAMTGIFLRELEYYCGVLFLTTNRVVMFDEAFCSRISMFLHYEKHDQETRATIWKTLLQRLQSPTDMGENSGENIEDLSIEFSEADFNGREIRNIIQTAVTLAKNKGENLNGDHLRKAWTSLATSMEELKLVQSPLDKNIFKERKDLQNILDC